MITVQDIFFKVAQTLRSYSSDADRQAAIEEFVAGSDFQLNIAITTDVEEAEELFLDRVGPGETFYFKVPSYEYGLYLAGQLHWVMQGEHMDVDGHEKPAAFLEIGDAQLYLVLHVRMFTRPVVRKTSVAACA